MRYCRPRHKKRGVRSAVFAESQMSTLHTHARHHLEPCDMHAHPTTSLASRVPSPTSLLHDGHLQMRAWPQHLQHQSEHLPASAGHTFVRSAAPPSKCESDP
eukprot:23008-Rhodomonas_salina.6